MIGRLVCIQKYSSLRSDNKERHFSSNSFSPLFFAMILREIRMDLNHLLLMEVLTLFAKSESHIDSLLKTVQKSSTSVAMRFWISRCAVFTIKRARNAVCRGIKLQYEVIAEPNESGYT